MAWKEKEPYSKIDKHISRILSTLDLTRPKWFATRLLSEREALAHRRIAPPGKSEFQTERPVPLSWNSNWKRSMRCQITPARTKTCECWSDPAAIIHSFEGADFNFLNERYASRNLRHPTGETGRNSPNWKFCLRKLPMKWFNMIGFSSGEKAVQPRDALQNHWRNHEPQPYKLLIDRGICYSSVINQIHLLQKSGRLHSSSAAASCMTYE